MSKFMVDVSDMYEICKDAQTPLLSNYSAPFWLDYVQNYARYDKVFYRMFKSFTPFSQEPISYFNVLTNEQKQSVTTDFIEDVYNHLLINTKKYSELYRVNVVDDASYNILNNYNITETLEGSKDSESTTTYGEREDSKSNTNIYGQESDEKSVTSVYGAQTDNKSDSTIYGEQTDSKSDSTVYGSKTTTKNETIGSRTDSSTYTQGQQANASTQQVAPYDDEDFYNKEKVTDSVGGRSDSSGFTTGSQSNSDSINEGSHTDTLTGSYVKGTHTDSSSGSYTKGSHTDGIDETFTKGSHTDNLSESFTKGEQEDASVSSETKSSTLTKTGLIGNKTATEIMNEHERFWKSYEFYIYIFKQIARELLLV